MPIPSTAPLLLTAADYPRVDPRFDLATAQ
jgi:hypothetical protein